MAFTIKTIPNLPRRFNDQTPITYDLLNMAATPSFEMEGNLNEFIEAVEFIGEGEENLLSIADEIDINKHLKFPGFAVGYNHFSYIYNRKILSRSFSPKTNIFTNRRRSFSHPSVRQPDEPEHLYGGAWTDPTAQQLGKKQYEIADDIPHQDDVEIPSAPTVLIANGDFSEANTLMTGNGIQFTENRAALQLDKGMYIFQNGYNGAWRWQQYFGTDQDDNPVEHPGDNAVFTVLRL